MVDFSGTPDIIPQSFAGKDIILFARYFENHECFHFHTSPLSRAKLFFTSIPYTVLLFNNVLTKITLPV